jgi:putative Mg2+ transporter-C (MgtC) family protein
VRGLTTAAIGILVGIGFWLAAIVGAAAVLSILAIFRLIEARLPSGFYAHHVLCFARDKVMPEGKLREPLGNHGFSIANLSSCLTDSAGSSNTA